MIPSLNTPPSQPFLKRATWLEAIPRCLGRTWKTAVSFSTYLLSLASKIISCISHVFKRYAQPHTGSSKPFQASLQSSSALPPLLLVRSQSSETGNLAALLHNDSDDEITNLDSGDLGSTRIDLPEAQLSARSSIQDVPGDGNCLFYAIGVGLKKKLSARADIQDKLQWNPNLEDLEGDLFHKKDTLLPVAQRLRQQAADYIRNYLKDFYIRHQCTDLKDLDLGSSTPGDDDLAWEIKTNGIWGYNEKIDDELKNAEASLPHCNNDAERETKRASIESEKANLIPDGDAEAYLNRLEKDGVFCGNAQVMALSRTYSVPIIMWQPMSVASKDPNFQAPSIQGRSLEPQLIEGKFHHAEIHGKHFDAPALEIVLVNGDHFRYKNS